MKNIKKSQIIILVLLLISAIIPFLSWYGRYYSIHSRLECLGVGLLIIHILHLLPKKYDTIVGVVGLLILALFNSYARVCEDVFGEGALCFLSTTLFFASYVFLIIKKYTQSKEITRLGTIIFVLNTLLCLLFCYGRISVIYECSSILRFAALAIVWWSEMEQLVKERKTSHHTKHITSIDFAVAKSELLHLKKQHEEGKITEQEYKEARAKFLDSI